MITIILIIIININIGYYDYYMALWAKPNVPWFSKPSKGLSLQIVTLNTFLKDKLR